MPDREQRDAVAIIRRHLVEAQYALYLAGMRNEADGARQAGKIDRAIAGFKVAGLKELLREIAPDSAC